MASTANITRRALLIVGFTCILLFLTSCTSEQQTNDFTLIALKQFPQTLGRGFATIENVFAEQQANIGETAPNFSLILENGQGIQLADLKGEPVVINFWATWCGPCRMEMPELVALHEASTNLVVLAINVQEDLEQVKTFAEDFNMTMPVLLDVEGKASRVYGVRGLPVTIFINAEGKIVSRWDGMLTARLLAEQVTELQ